MVSYYNTLSSMFPSAHHPGAQPHPIAAGRHSSAHSPAVVAAAAAQVNKLYNLLIFSLGTGITL
jgi:hypothetical protein